MRWVLRKSKQNFILSSFPTARSRGARPKLRFSHTFFLPKRERKYQRKRFRAATRTPRGHRSCSAPSALEIWRRLQRCNCSSQNEALAPLPGRKAHVLAVAILFSRRRRREHGFGARYPCRRDSPQKFSKTFVKECNFQLHRKISIFKDMRPCLFFCGNISAAFR